MSLELLQRVFDIEPTIQFEAEDYMLCAYWKNKDGAITCSAIVAFDVRDACKLLNSILAQLDRRADNA